MRNLPFNVAQFYGLGQAESELTSLILRHLGRVAFVTKCGFGDLLQVELEIAAFPMGNRFGGRGLGLLQERRRRILGNGRENGRLGAIPGSRFGGGGRAGRF